MNFTTLETFSVLGSRTAFIVSSPVDINKKQLIGSDCILDGLKCRVVGVESYGEKIKTGEKIAIITETI